MIGADAIIKCLEEEGVSTRPIAIMIGPVTTGGKNLITFSMPTALIIAARMK
jgi:hypothetical protein